MPGLCLSGPIAEDRTTLMQHTFVSGQLSVQLMHCCSAGAKGPHVPHAQDALNPVNVISREFKYPVLDCRASITSTVRSVESQRTSYH